MSMFGTQIPCNSARLKICKKNQYFRNIRVRISKLTFLTGTLAIKSMCLTKCLQYSNPTVLEALVKISIVSVKFTLAPITNSLPRE